MRAVARRCARVASMPLSPGICRSISTTSGCEAAASGRSLLLGGLRLADDLQVGRPSRAKRAARRGRTGWSSAIRMRTGIHPVILLLSLGSGSARAARACRRRAPPRRRSCRPTSVGPLAHRGEADARPACSGGETRPSSDDLQLPAPSASTSGARRQCVRAARGGRRWSAPPGRCGRRRPRPPLAAPEAWRRLDGDVHPAPSGPCWRCAACSPDRAETAQARRGRAGAGHRPGAGCRRPPPAVCAFSSAQQRVGGCADRWASRLSDGVRG